MYMRSEWSACLCVLNANYCILGHYELYNEKQSAPRMHNLMHIAEQVEYK